MNKKLIPTKMLGWKAQQVLSTALEFKVLGTTSRGVFLYFAPQWVVFCTAEKHCGPLTINLETNCAELALGQVGTNRQGLLDFGQLAIDTREAINWGPVPPPQSAQSSHEQRWQRVLELNERCQAIRAPSELAYLLELKRFTYGDILGQGQGLTPSGDDVMAGILLYETRQGLVPTWDLSKLATQACEKTTTLSSNLLQMAALGQGDERLIELTDYVLTGASRYHDRLAALDFLSWGAHSGMDTLLGITIAAQRQHLGHPLY